MTEASSKTREGQVPRVLFRVDGGRIWGVSLGHVFRCMALAGELQKQYQADVGFLMKDYEDGISVVRERGFTVRSVWRKASWDQERALIESLESDLVIFDVIDIAEKDLGQLDDGIQTVVIDDTGNKRIEADVVVNGSIVEEFRRYPQISKATRYYLGPRYCILGEEFDDLPTREIREGVKTILVCMGGSDPAGLTVKVVQALATRPLGATINVVLGPAFGDEDAIRQVVAQTNNDFVIHRNVPSMAEMMLQADLAITAGGRTAYELAATGTPGIIVPSSEDELKVAGAFEHAGTCISLETWHPDVSHPLADRLNMLLKDWRWRMEMSMRGKEIVDARGRKRVARC